MRAGIPVEKCLDHHLHSVKSTLHEFRVCFQVEHLWTTIVSVTFIAGGTGILHSQQGGYRRSRDHRDQVQQRRNRQSLELRPPSRHPERRRSGFLERAEPLHPPGRERSRIGAISAEDISGHPTTQTVVYSQGACRIQKQDTIRGRDRASRSSLSEAWSVAAECHGRDRLTVTLKVSQDHAGTETSSGVERTTGVVNTEQLSHL